MGKQPNLGGFSDSLKIRNPHYYLMKMVMTFVYPTVSYGCQTWCLNTDAKSCLDTWWMKVLRRIRGVTKKDRLRNVKVLEDLRTSMLSEMIEERQLRYLGHVWRYGENRWTKFILQAARPGQTNTGKQLQLRKHLSKLLAEKKLTLDMATHPDSWAKKLDELYPRKTGKEEEKDENEHESGSEEKTAVGDPVGTDL